MSLIVSPPYQFFTDIDGSPLEAGKIYIGQSGLDPQTAPITVYWDNAASITAAQPIRTVAGAPDRSGSPGEVFSLLEYSITVLNQNDVVVYSNLAAKSIVQRADDLSTKSEDIASAATTDLALATGVNVTITGAGPITNFGVLPYGVKRTLITEQPLEIVHSPANIILFGGVNLITTAGDSLEMMSLGGGKWKLLDHSRSDGTSTITAPHQATTSPGINDDITGGHRVGDAWQNTALKLVYECFSNTEGAAEWILLNPTVQLTKANYIHVVQFSSSGIFTAPYKCDIRMADVGGGGGGGAHKLGPTSKATGGGAGGCATKEFTAEAGETFTIVVGSAGVGGIDAVGTDGGNSSIVSLSGPSAINMIAVGGTGGGEHAASNVTRGVGGTATGGDDNFKGGDGGDATADASASGGGAVGLVGNGKNASIPAGSSTSAGGKNNLGAANDTLFNVANGAYDGGDGDLAGAADATGGSGIYGGGGGGAITTGVGNARAGNGGEGVVLIQYTGEIA